MTSDDDIDAMLGPEDPNSSAILSNCGTYRYRLERRLGHGPTVAAVFGVNPSTADAVLDDQTVKKWRGFGECLGWDRFIVGNLFAYRATNVRELAHAEDPVGLGNDGHIHSMIVEADILIPCWGSLRKLPPSLWPRANEVMDRLLDSGKPVYCWGLTQDGDPKHPLMLGYKTPLIQLFKE